MINPDNDGIDHINIYSRGKTQLGKMLSNWYPANVEISIGSFKTIEGVIFYLSSFNDFFRNADGYNCKKYGKDFDKGIRLPEDVFRKFIIDSMLDKVNKNDTLKCLLKESNLPLKHYYNYSGKIIEVMNWQWQVDEWENIRKGLKE